MAKLFDENGNEIEVMGEEEIAALEEKAKLGEEAQEKAKALEEVLQQKEEELSKFSDKEFNFKRFRDSEEAKRTEMLEGFSAKEQTLIKEIEGMQKRQEESDQMYFGQTKEDLLHNLVGDDTEVRQKLEDLVKEMYPQGVPRQREEMEKAYRRGVIVLEREQGINPLNKFAPVTGAQTGESKGRDFSNTPEGKAVIEKKFAKELEKVKAKNPNFEL